MGHSSYMKEFPNTYVFKHITQYLSYSTIVLYSRDHQGLGVAHKKISPKNQPHFSHTMWQYWLGKTKLKKVFRSTRNAFNKLLQNFKIFHLTEFSTH